MLSAGNDIVALGSINPERTHDPRFYRQILSRPEQDLFHNTIHEFLSFTSFVWLAWSVKESGFKYAKRLNPQLVFSPTKICLTAVIPPRDPAARHFKNGEWESALPDRSFYQGSFVMEGNTYFFRSKLCEEFIASVVSDESSFEDITWGVRRIDTADTAVQSSETRLFLLNRLARHFPGDGLQITPSNGRYPQVIHDNRLLDIPVSLSHHQNFLSYSFSLPPSN